MSFWDELGQAGQQAMGGDLAGAAGSLADAAGEAVDEVADAAADAMGAVEAAGEEAAGAVDDVPVIGAPLGAATSAAGMAAGAGADALADLRTGGAASPPPAPGEAIGGFVAHVADVTGLDEVDEQLGEITGQLRDQVAGSLDEAAEVAASAVGQGTDAVADGLARARSSLGESLDAAARGEAGGSLDVGVELGGQRFGVRVDGAASLDDGVRADLEAEAAGAGVETSGHISGRGADADLTGEALGHDAAVSAGVEVRGGLGVDEGLDAWGGLGVTGSASVDDRTVEGGIEQGASVRLGDDGRASARAEGDLFGAKADVAIHRDDDATDGSVGIGVHGSIGSLETELVSGGLGAEGGLDESGVGVRGAGGIGTGLAGGHDAEVAVETGLTHRDDGEGATTTRIGGGVGVEVDDVAVGTAEAWASSTLRPGADGVRNVIDAGVRGGTDLGDGHEAQVAGGVDGTVGADLEFGAGVRAHLDDTTAATGGEVGVDVLPSDVSGHAGVATGDEVIFGAGASYDATEPEHALAPADPMTGERQSASDEPDEALLDDPLADDDPGPVRRDDDADDADDGRIDDHAEDDLGE